jgi:mannitol-specific phosphotransferase system IIBC component
MENEKLKQFLIPILLIFAIIMGIIFIAPKIKDSILKYTGVQSEIKTLQATVQQKENMLAEYSTKEQTEKAQEQANQESGKPFYKPVVEGMDTDAAIAGELEEILQLVRANKIKVRSIKNDSTPKDDKFYQNASAQYNVARLNMEMIANYVNYDNFLKELYKHEHFLDIESVKIVPYKKNKKILLISFNLKLYAKK